MLYAPILICHDIQKEVKREQVSESFRRVVLKLDERRDEVGSIECLSERMSVVVDMFRSLGEFLQTLEIDEQRAQRRNQLAGVLKLYGKALPAGLLYKYNGLVEDNEWWRISGQKVAEGISLST